MILLVPLFATALCVWMGTEWIARHRAQRTGGQASWQAAAAAGMAMVFIFTGITHFVEPDRSGLVAIIPTFVPEPELAVTLSGLMEFALAVGLVIPRTRRWAALASVAFLIALFPANVIAAGGVDHPAAPTTPLLPRAFLQLVFIGFSAAPLLSRRRSGHDTTDHRQPRAEARQADDAVDTARTAGRTAT